MTTAFDRLLALKWAYQALQALEQDPAQPAALQHTARGIRASFPTPEEVNAFLDMDRQGLNQGLPKPWARAVGLAWRLLKSTTWGQQTTTKTATPGGPAPALRERAE
jgi:hypothetical protein